MEIQFKLTGKVAQVYFTIKSRKYMGRFNKLKINYELYSVRIFIRW